MIILGASRRSVIDLAAGGRIPVQLVEKARAERRCFNVKPLSGRTDGIFRLKFIFQLGDAVRTSEGAGFGAGGELVAEREGDPVEGSTLGSALLGEAECASDPLFPGSSAPAGPRSPSPTPEARREVEADRWASRLSGALVARISFTCSGLVRRGE